MAEWREGGGRREEGWRGEGRGLVWKEGDGENGYLSRPSSFLISSFVLRPSPISSSSSSSFLKNSVTGDNAQIHAWNTLFFFFLFSLMINQIEHKVATGLSVRHDLRVKSLSHSLHERQRRQREGHSESLLEQTTRSQLPLWSAFFPGEHKREQRGYSLRRR